MDGLRAMWRSQPSFTTQRLATIKAPTAIADSEYYEIIKREQTEEMSREVPNAKLILQPAARVISDAAEPGGIQQDSVRIPDGVIADRAAMLGDQVARHTKRTRPA